MTATAVAPIEPIDRAAEQQLLGALLSIGKLGAVIAETRLAPEHFSRTVYADIYRAMLALRDRSVVLDLVTVADELQKRGKLEEVGGKAYLSELELSATGRELNAISHARIVVDKAKWRQRLAAGQEIRDASIAEDPEKYATAAEKLAEGVETPDSFYGEDRQRDLIFDLMQGKSKAEFAWPFPKLNTLQSGGMRRGQLIIVSGHTGDGKSLLGGQILDVNHANGRRVRLYTNEMSVEEEAARRVTRQTGVPYSALMDGKLTDGQRRKVMDYLNSSSLWPMIDIAGWSGVETAHHIRAHRPDLAVIDILHNFAFNEEREIAAIVKTFKAAAKIANCCVIVVAHIGRGATEKGRRRQPRRSDLKWSGDIENLADAICFVYRMQDEETLEILNDGYVYFDKVRGGRIGSQKAHVNPFRLEWELSEWVG